MSDLVWDDPVKNPGPLPAIIGNDRDHSSPIADHCIAANRRQLFGPRSIPTGCQRLSEVFCNTVGLTQLTGHMPCSTSDNSWPTRRLRASSKRAEADATCAVRVTFSMRSIGLLCEGGSFSS